MSKMTYSSIPLSTINNISISANSSNSTLVFFKVACHANPGAERNNMRQMFLKFSKTAPIVMYRF